MTSREPYVSPYLLRPLRSYEQARRDRDRLRNPVTRAISSSDTAQHEGSDESGASMERRREP